MLMVQVVLLLVAFGTPQLEEPRRFSTTVALLEGEWVLDESLSQDPEEVIRNALRDRRRGRRPGGIGGRGPGRGRGGFGGVQPRRGGQGPGDDRSPGAGLPGSSSTRLEFRGQGEGLVLNQDDGRTRYLVVDGTWQERRGPDGSAIETKTEWVESKLVIVTRADGRPGDRTEEYEVLPEHDRLVLTLSVELPLTDEAVTIRRVFNRPVVEESPDDHE